VLDILGTTILLSPTCAVLGIAQPLGSGLGEHRVPGLPGVLSRDPSPSKPPRASMPHPDQDASPVPTPPSALQQATEELYDVEDTDVIRQRATEITRQRQEREDERHDEYDDPDEGGEA